MALARSFVRLHRHWALLLIAAALVMRAVLPSGTMVEARGHSLSVVLCDGMGAKRITVTIPASPDQSDAAGKHLTGGAAVCAFAGADAPATGSVPPVVHAAALAWMSVAGLRPGAAFSPPVLRFLLPPQQAPPHPA